MEGVSLEDLRKVRCHRCKEIYTFNEGLPPDYCPKCTEEKEANIRKIRDLIRDNRGICAMELEKLTGIPINFILELLNKGEITVKKQN